MADVTDSKSVGETRVGSSPTTGTTGPGICRVFFSSPISFEPQASYSHKAAAPGAA